MISKAHHNFWACYRELPTEVQRLASRKYRVWLADPFHPALHFKELAANVWSVRINRDYRALGRRRGDTIIWFWIGTHEEYNNLIRRLQGS